MGIMRKTLLERTKARYPDIHIQETYGYITKYIREINKMPKSHINDALCIARHQKAKRAETDYLIKPIRAHNRQIHKVNPRKGGIRPRNQSAKNIHGFKLFDKVRYNNQTGFITGKRSSGNFLLKTIDNKLIANHALYKRLTLLQHTNRYIIQKKGNTTLPHS